MMSITAGSISSHSCLYKALVAVSHSGCIQTTVGRSLYKFALALSFVLSRTIPRNLTDCVFVKRGLHTRLSIRLGRSGLTASVPAKVNLVKGQASENLLNTESEW